MVKLMGKNPSISLSTAPLAKDARSWSKDYKRDADSKHKWSPKWGIHGAPTVKEGPNGTKRPIVHRCSQRAAAKDSRYRADESRRNNVQRKRPVLNDDSSGSQDSSADEDLSFGVEATQVCEADVKYSYDASRGPARGSEILGLAVSKAVEKYEDEKTNKLVNDEYEILDSMSEADVDESPSFDEDEDGFELI